MLFQCIDFMANENLLGCLGHWPHCTEGILVEMGTFDGEKVST